LGCALGYLQSGGQNQKHNGGHSKLLLMVRRGPNPVPCGRCVGRKNKREGQGRGEQKVGMSGAGGGVGGRRGELVGAQGVLSAGWLAVLSTQHRQKQQKMVGNAVLKPQAIFPHTRSVGQSVRQHLIHPVGRRTLGTGTPRSNLARPSTLMGPGSLGNYGNSGPGTPHTTAIGRRHR